MRVLVVLLAAHKELRERFIVDQDKVIRAQSLPKSFQESVVFEARACNPSELTAPSDFEAFLLHEIETIGDVDAVAVLADAQCDANVRNVRDALLVGTADLSGFVENIQNLLSFLLAKLVRNIGHLIAAMQSAVEYQAACLPLRNFDAPELRELARVCRDESLAATLPSHIKIPLGALMRRRGPKRRSEYPERHFKDDRGMYFRYGLERHAAFETGGQHQKHCHLCGLYRFGVRLENARHYNVSGGDNGDERIDTEWPNCHDELVVATNRTHLNIFSNDFHKRKEGIIC